MLSGSTSMPWSNISVTNISDSKVLGVSIHVRRGHVRKELYQEKGTILTSSTSMPWPNISVANIAVRRGHVRKGVHQEKGTILTSSTSMPWPNILVANISDSKALGVRDHVRKGSCWEGAMSGEGHVRRGHIGRGKNVGKFYINVMVKYICCKHKW